MKQHVGALWLTGTALAFANPAWGQETPTVPPAPAGSESPDGSDTASSAADRQADDSGPVDVIVTAQKRSERLIDVPQSVSVVSAETLQNQHARRLSDYLTRIP